MTQYRSYRWLLTAPNKPNLANDLTEQELSALAQDVIRSYDIDRQNRKEWDDQSQRALKLAKQVLEKKNKPWPGASNVKYPLITVATIQFAARAYPEICKGSKIVKCQITGDDVKQKQLPPLQLQPGQPPTGPTIPQGGALMLQAFQQGSQDGMMPPKPGGQNQSGQQQMLSFPPSQESSKQQKASRISAHMNWQLTQQMSDWEADMDCLLHVLPVVGQCYKKTYFSAQDNYNCSELVLPDDCVVSKGRSRDLKKARRITHRLWIYTNDAVEKFRNGSWKETDLGQAPTTDNDTDAPHELLEQHRWDDLDGDGYKEPYIVTVHRVTAKVVRVAARWIPDNVEFSSPGKVSRIIPDHYFTHYGFIPNPDGSINYLGFGQLLEAINESVNTTINQLHDGGTAYTSSGGFIGRGVKLRGGTFSFTPNEFKLVDCPGGQLKDNIVPLPVKEPSIVLFQLLGFLVQASKEISSIQDILTGDAKLAANMPVGTAMALVEQGLKVFTGIYKRIYRSLSEEFKKLYNLNARFLEPEESFFISGHPEQFINRSDYTANDTLVMPVADPELSSDMQRLLKAQALKEVSGRPGLNEIEVSRRLIRSIRPENMEELLLTDGQIAGREPTPWQPPPPPQQVLAQAKAQRMMQQAQEAQIRLQMDMLKFKLEVQELEAKITNVKADSILKLAKAEDEVRGDYVEMLKQEIDIITREVEQKVAGIKKGVDDYASQSGNPNQSVRASNMEEPANIGGSPGSII